MNSFQRANEWGRFRGESAFSNIDRILRGIPPTLGSILLLTVGKSVWVDMDRFVNYRD